MSYSSVPRNAVHNNTTPPGGVQVRVLGQEGIRAGRHMRCDADAVGARDRTVWPNDRIRSGSKLRADGFLACSPGLGGGLPCEAGLDIHDMLQHGSVRGLGIVPGDSIEHLAVAAHYVTHSIPRGLEVGNGLGGYAEHGFGQHLEDWVASSLCHQ